MANEHWYVLKVRSGFASIVAKKLRRLNLEIVVSRSKSIDTRKSHMRNRSPSNHVYCRFALENRLTVTSVPGVIEILGAPEPTVFRRRMGSLRFRPTAAVARDGATATAKTSTTSARTARAAK